jgi:hypothetical protein
VPQRYQDYESPKWRTFWMMLGFAVLVGIGIATVLRPEFENAPGNETSTEPDAGGEPGTGRSLQE